MRTNLEKWNFYLSIIDDRTKEFIDLLLENYGKKVLRKNEHDRWVETNLNDTYLELIIEFPEDYALPFLNLYPKK